MAIDWTTKEKIVLLSNILEFGDQPENWSAISNELSRTFPTNVILLQPKRDGRYSIKNCKQEYKYLVDRYKSEWIEHGSSTTLKLPLAKYIWIQLKSIYRSELTYQLNESRKKLTEFYLCLETAVNVKSNTIEPTLPPTATEITTPLIIHQENEQQEEKIPTMEVVSQPTKPISDIPPSEPSVFILPDETIAVPSIFDSSKKQITISTPIFADPPQIKEEPQINEEPQIKPEPQIKEEPHIEIPNDTILNEINRQSFSNTSLNLSLTEQDIPQQTPIGSSSSLNLPPDQKPSLPQATISTPPLIPTTAMSESASSSRSTSRTSSETKTDIIKIIPTTTPKYHVYFSPKNSINNTFGINKIKPKRIKDENEIESTPQPDTSSSSTTELSKLPSSTAPITRRSVNTRSVPNTAVEQEEEKSRRFSAMLTENPNSWQSQSMAIIQFILSHKQGYLFEHEITDEIAPKYHQYIRHPIALHTIRKTLESNDYQTKDYFKRDVYLMLYNAMKYNPRHHHVHRSAKHIFNITVPLFNLSAQDIHGQITIKSNLSATTTSNDVPVAKRQRTK